MTPEEEAALGTPQDFEPAPKEEKPRQPPEGESLPEYAKPDPKANPRNISLGEIAAKQAKQHVIDAAETAAVVDDEGRIVSPAPASPPADQPPVEPARAPAPAEGASPPVAAPSASPAALEDPFEKPLDPEGDYEVIVDGQKLVVKGKAIIDAGRRTFQKETAADFRLRLASDLLKEAEAKVAGATPPGAPPAKPEKPKEMSDEELAQALQFGTPEQAAEATKTLRGRGAASPDQISGFVRNATRDEVQFQQAISFVESEYKDLLDNPHLKDLFFLQENKARAGGDKRPYKELYKSIGEDLRKAFNLPQPGAAPASAAATPPASATPAERSALKARTAPVPRTAAARLSGVSESATKVKTPSEIIAEMQARRGQHRLTPQLRKE